MPISNTAYDGLLLSSTINKWLASNFLSLWLHSNPVFTKIFLSGNIKPVGGALFQVPLAFPATGGPSAAGVSDGYAAVTHTSMTGFSSATYSTSEYFIPISAEDYYLTLNAGDTQKIDYMGSVVKQGVNRMMAKLEQDFWAAEETSGSNGARNSLMSIRTLCNAGTATTTTDGLYPYEIPQQLGLRAVAGATSATPLYTIGGISRIATSGAGRWCVPIENTSQALTVQVLSDLMLTATQGTESPNIVAMPLALYSKLQNLLTVGGGNGGQMFNGSSVADFGFNRLRFQGADVIADRSCPTATYLAGTTTAYNSSIFALNTNFLEVHAKTMKPQITMVNQDRPLTAGKAQWFGAFVANHAGNVHARHVNATA